MIELTGEALAEALCRELEPELPEVPGSERWQCEKADHRISSPLGFFKFTRYPQLGWHAIRVDKYIDETWRVVDEMRRLGWLIVIKEKAGGGWLSRFIPITLEFESTCELGDDPLEAICRASYAALRSMRTPERKVK
jgi:hypothetical protein